MYELKQAPRTWYEKLISFLLKNGFERGKVDATLFNKNYNSQFILVLVYVDEIIFGVINEMLCEEECHSQILELVQHKISLGLFHLGMRFYIHLIQLHISISHK